MTALTAIRQRASTNGVGASSGAIPGPSYSAKIGKSEMQPYQLELFY
jgi:hypothetical protein